MVMIVRKRIPSNLGNYIKILKGLLSLGQSRPVRCFVFFLRPFWDLRAVAELDMDLIDTAPGFLVRCGPLW